MSSLIRRGLGLISRFLPEPGILVGVDRAGNKFYKREEINHKGEEVERRFMKPPVHVDPEDFDLMGIGVEWHSWLGKNRDDPPTPEESAELERQRESVREKVAILAAEEAKRKVRARALKPQDAATPDLGMLHLQMGSEEGRINQHEGSADKPKESKPDQSIEPSGTGDTFTPGKWQPPGK
mmetsp:Transcript_4366/g.5852  ORF Transcript_4366/g.5852 Transcript_4366/m.5852 type:complete len:181 (+) Transcript_4366:69-611(+)